MKKSILALGLGMVIVSCSSADSKFCDCLEAGENLNNYAEKFMTEQASTAEAEELKKLREAKETACKDYQTMDGKLMLEKKKACEEK